MIKCTINDYYKYFIDAGKMNNIPKNILDELDKIFDNMMEDAIWKAPEQQPYHNMETKNLLAEVVINKSTYKEPWYLSMKFIYENYCVV